MTDHPEQNVNVKKAGGWPLSGAWAIGTLLGIRILFAGWSLIILGSVVRSLPERA